MKVLLSLWCSVSLWFGPGIAAEIEKAKRELLALDHRPTIEELVQKLDPMPISNPFKALVNDHYSNKLDEAARFIVELEYAYPGSTWALLGRDSSLSADILEAFYMKEGQKERVVRLNASGDSFGKGIKYQLNFLYTAGLVDSSGAPLKKFVILDSTRWHLESQSRRLLQSTYQTIDPLQQSNYLPFVNVINIADKIYEKIGKPIIPSLDLPHFWRLTNISGGTPKNILHATGFTYLPQAANEIEIVWHDKFQPFYLNEDKTVVAPRGNLNSEKDREHVLWWMYEVHKKVNSHVFKSKVEQIAKEYNRDFASCLRQYRPTFKEAVKTWLDQFQNEQNAQKIDYFISVLKQFSCGLNHQFIGFSAEARFVSAITSKHGFQSGLLNYFPSGRLLMNADTADKFISAVRSMPGETQKANIRASLRHFFSLNPSVDQVNQLIRLVKRNGTTHQLIAGSALATINNLKDYQELNRPWRVFRKDKYKKSKDQFKKAHPGYFEKTKPMLRLFNSLRAA